MLCRQTLTVDFRLHDHNLHLYPCNFRNCSFLMNQFQCCKQMFPFSIKKTSLIVSHSAFIIIVCLIRKKTVTKNRIMSHFFLRSWICMSKYKYTLALRGELYKHNKKMSTIVHVSWFRKNFLNNWFPSFISFFF